ncbi:MAG: RDD family protein [Pseudomonadota bacterium]|nr:RDD family protein [Pseudomonadota bacterium]
MLDTLTQVETPEGTALRLRAAGMLPRAAAWAVDFGLRLVIVWMLSVLLLMLGEAGMGLYLIVLFLFFWFYPVLFEVLRDGQTIGKKALGLRVINANGTPVTWLASIVRNLMRTVDMLPAVYGFGFVAGLIDPRGRRLGDMVAGTLVVHVEKPHQHIAAPNVPVVHPAMALNADEKAAIIAFAERAQQLTPERQRELADILPMLSDARGSAGVQRLLGMASSFLGRR